MSTWNIKKVGQALVIRYAFAVAVIVIAAALRAGLVRLVGPLPPFVTLYPAVLLVVSVAGGGPGVLASLLAAFVADYFFFGPHGRPRITAPNETVALAIFTGSNLCLCLLAERLHRTRHAEAISAAQAAELLQRQRIEEELRESKERLHVTLASIGDGVIATDELGRVTFLNPVAQALTGWTQAEALGQPSARVFEIINEQTRQPAKDIVAQVLHEKCIVALANHAVVVSRDGREIPIEDSAAPIMSGAGAVVGAVLVFHDVTQRRREQETLRQSEEQFRAIFETASIGMAQADPQSGRWLRVNQKMCAITGYSAEEMIGMRVPEITHPDDRQRDWEAFQHVVRGEAPSYHLEKRYLRKDGTVAWINVNMTVLHDAAGQPVRTIGVIEDITERKRAEAALRLSEEKFTQAFTSNPAAIALTRLEDGVFLDVNETWTVASGYTREEALGRSAREMPIWPSAEAAARFVQELREHGALRGWEQEFFRKSGEVYVAQLSAQLLTVHGEQLILSTLVDITGRKQAEQAVRRQAEKLERLLDVVPVAVCVASDPQCLSITGNRRANEFYEAGEGENVSASTAPEARRYFTPEGRELTPRELPMQVAAATNRDVRDTEFHVLTPSGRRIAMLGSAVPLRDDQGEVCGCIGAFLDITERKRAEAALHENEQRHRILFEQATEGIALADAETGEILDCNQAFLQLGGFERADVIGKSQTMLHPREAGNPPVSKTFEQHRSDQEGAVLEAELLTKSGATKQVEIKANVLELGGRAVAQAFFRDVTAELRHEREREMTLELMRRLNDPSNTHELIRDLTDLIRNWTGCEAVGVRLRDGDDYPYFETQGFSSEFVQAENSLCSHNECGQLERDAQGKPLLACMCGNILHGRFNPALPFFTPKGSFWSNGTTQLLASSSAEDLRAHTRNRCIGEGYESVALFALRHGDRVLGLLQVNDRAKSRFTPESITFLEGLADQIALALAQRQAQSDLLKSEQFNREVIAGVQEGLVVYDRDFHYLVWNPFMEELTGLSADQVLGKVELDLYPHMRDYAVEGLLQRALAGETTQSSDMHFHIAQTGKSGWISSTYSPHCDPQGKVIGVIGIIRDITRRKRAEEDKEAMEAQFRQAQKMESVGRLAGGVAHDFNNMLSVIVGYSEIALGQLQSSDPLYQDIQEIMNAGQRSSDLTRQLLAFARKQAIQPKVLDLNDTIAGMLKMLVRLIGEDIDLLWKPCANLWPVMMDPAQLDQILANLTVNARDAIGGVGKITIETGKADLSEDYCQTHVGALPGRYVLLAVSDNGCGMDAETQAHLFEPFFTTKPQGQGTGLGLATVYGIVKQNNGFIRVYSEPGHGTTFKLYLPRHESEDSSAEMAPESAEALRGTETVLLVEDEKALLELSKKLLARLGYTVLAAGSPSQALQLAREYPGAIQLLLTDVVMPEVSGRELQQRLSALRPQIKCLFMSGYTADVIAHQGVLDPDVHFLQKPFSNETLAAKLREALES